MRQLRQYSEHHALDPSTIHLHHSCRIRHGPHSINERRDGGGNFAMPGFGCLINCKQLASTSGHEALTTTLTASMTTSP